MIETMLHELENQIQNYAWGSSDALADLYGFRNPERKPMAELWMGAHPLAPSRLAGTDETLADYIASDPVRALGRDGADRSSGLPFLFKILCAAEPLSIQVHPSLEQAREGYRRENELGVDPSDSARNYRDANHKPELICAIRPFWGLRGFRTLDDIRDELTTVEFMRADVRLEPPRSDTDLACLFRTLLTLSERVRRDLVAAAVALARGRWHGSDTELPEPGNPLARYFWVLRIADRYPGDPGILAPLLMHVFALRPGEATYQPAGVLHAYLHGVGAELMANSDNVLRGGMTPKHIDVAELMKIGRFVPEETPVLSGRSEHRDGCDEISYETPFDEFAFSRLRVTDCTVAADTPQILFCHSGEIRLMSGGNAVTLRPGQSLFADADGASIHATGEGELFRACLPPRRMET